MVEQSDSEILACLRQSSADDLRFWSNNEKEARERWVVSEFLRDLPLQFTEDELSSPPQNSDIDVAFRDANFQIKDILNPGIKLHGESKALNNALEKAETLHDFTEFLRTDSPFVYDVPAPTTIYALVMEQAKYLSLSAKYSSVKSTLDLLFYVTRSRASHIRSPEIDQNSLASLGWRSISCLAGSQAVVLYAHEQAPEFLRLAQTVTCLEARWLGRVQ